jgi:hypothetical protein
MGEGGDNECPLTWSRAHEALTLKVTVSLQNRVRVDRQLGNDLLRRRQLVARLQEAKTQGLMDLLDKLQIGSYTARCVELEFDHNPPSTNPLVEGYHSPWSACDVLMWWPSG